jgi:hypothetical protein
VDDDYAVGWSIHASFLLSSGLCRFTQLSSSA